MTLLSRLDQLFWGDRMRATVGRNRRASRTSWDRVAAGGDHHDLRLADRFQDEW